MSSPTGKVNFAKLAISKLVGGDIEILQDLDVTLFTDKEKKLYELILDHYTETSSLPSKITLQAIIDDKAPKKVAGIYQAVVQGLPESADISSDEIVSGLKNSRTLKAVDDRIENLLEAQRGRDFDEVKNILADTLQLVSMGNLELKNFADAMEEDEVIESVPSGLGEDYDELLGNRFAGVTLITSASGGGKSSLMLSSAIETFREGKAVLFVSLELSAKALGARLKAYICDIDFSRIIKDDLTEDERKLIATKMEEFWGDRKDEFTIITTPLDDKELLALVSVQAQAKSVKAVYIDYLGLVSSSKAGDSWKSLSDLVKTLHKFTMKFGIVVVTAAQIADAKITGTSVELTSRGSAELLFSSSVCIYLKHMENEDAVTFYMAKNRYAKLQAAIFENRLAYMKFIDVGIRL